MNEGIIRYAAVVVMAAALTGCQTLGSKSSARTYNLGDKIELKPFIATVYETQWLTQLGNGLEAKIPVNRFMLVRITVTNSGSSEAVLPQFSLIDDNGKIHNELPAADGFPNWLGLVRSIKPADSIAGNAVFDVEPQHYKLRFADEAENVIAFVDLPLNFSSEAPDLLPNPAMPPIPQTAPKQ